MESSERIGVGLASVTFRKMSPEAIVDLVRETGLQGIEWGGDVHVPPGDFERAREVGNLTREAGLKVVGYGSYHNLGKPSGKDHAPWEVVVETALALGAPMIRVWAGTKGAAETSPEEFAALAARARGEAAVAERNGLNVACEFHENTLTDSGCNAARFLDAVDHRAFRSLWQPMIGASVEENLSALRLIGKWIGHVHVFYWARAVTGPGFEQRPLREGKEHWLSYARESERFAPGAFHLLEFVRGGSPEQLRDDAAALKEIINKRDPCVGDARNMRSN